ncbi:MAG: hypothetical protein UY72_C0001G0010 [Candidatus Uhrbacteria bacterium GW2011_GWD2_52_7]|uniref:Uncharacterized protein n=1 Tax=Candidatus Uhrbacteria bacterium GW2011_GWD2_52_7 TaxID=1618989 RepID=A0A0G1XI23_9BACT|nr:MAG: hypothetical protein UY72_C0001G0010 [Candidatus Uhrbacteria bacterium GW2011_GWD2_52_7]
MLKHQNPFVQMAAHAIAGSLLGLVAGLVLGLIIQGISGLLLPFEDIGDGPWQVAPFLGMGFGTFLGAILGGLVGMKR